MKIMVYGIGQKELPVAKQWAETYQAELTFTTEELTPETVSLAKGCEAISFQQMRPIHEEAIYQQMAAIGIRFLSTRSAGIDGLNQAALKNYHIKAANVPVYSPRAIAEQALTLSMMLLRNIPRLMKREAQGSFVLDGLIGNEIHQQTVGIVGTGHIGFATAELFHALGATVIAYDKFPKENVEDILTYTENLESLVQQADIISLHMPYLPENHHLFDRKLFQLMKPEAFLVNTARGPIVDTKALIAALEEGQLAGAGLDTLENEVAFVNKDQIQRLAYPELDQLLAMDNVIISPHIAFYTLQASKILMESSLTSLYELATTGKTDSEIPMF